MGEDLIDGPAVAHWRLPQCLFQGFGFHVGWHIEVNTCRGQEEKILERSDICPDQIGGKGWVSWGAECIMCWCEPADDVV